MHGVAEGLMIGRMHTLRALRGSSLLLLVSLLGCDQLGVKDFHGSKILMTMSGATPTPAGSHLELWVRDSVDDAPTHQDIVRVLASEGRHPDTTPCASSDFCPRAAYKVIPAVDLDDGCMIVTDGPNRGMLLWKPEAQPGPADTDRQLQTAAILKRVCELSGGLPGTGEVVMRETGKTCAQLGGQPGVTGPLFAFVAWDDASDGRPSLAKTEMMSPDQRLALCSDTDISGNPNPGGFWAKSPFAYSGNPLELSRPVHGVLLGTVDYQALSPPQILGGIEITSDWSLLDAREMWFTQTAATIAALDPDRVNCAGGSAAACRGNVLLDGAAVPGGTGTIHFELTSPSVAGLSGSASIQIALDRSPEQF